jgi:hypothetical protein
VAGATRLGPDRTGNSLQSLPKWLVTLYICNLVLALGSAFGPLRWRNLLGSVIDATPADLIAAVRAQGLEGLVGGNTKGGRTFDAIILGRWRLPPAINLTRYAALIQVRNQAARVAILGNSRRPTHPMETLEARRRLLQPPSALGRKRLPGESYEAYRAFCIYRDQGPGRSLNKAWRQERAERGKGCPQARCPGRWRLWAREWKWVERAVSYDAVQNRAGLEHRCALEERRFEFEWENQVLLEELVSQIDSVLEKAPDAAGTDMTQKTKEKINGKFIRTTTTIVKCLNLFGYAALVKACRDTARLAILGVRPHDLFDFPAALLVRLN